MSDPRGEGHLSWEDTRKAARALKAARLAQEKARRSQADTGARLGWSTGKVQSAENALTRLTPADALAFAEAVGADLAGLGIDGLTQEAEGAGNWKC